MALSAERKDGTPWPDKPKDALSCSEAGNTARALRPELVKIWPEIKRLTLAKYNELKKSGLTPGDWLDIEIDGLQLKTGIFIANQNPSSIVANPRGDAFAAFKTQKAFFYIQRESWNDTLKPYLASICPQKEKAPPADDGFISIRKLLIEGSSQTAKWGNNIQDKIVAACDTGVPIGTAQQIELAIGEQTFSLKVCMKPYGERFIVNIHESSKDTFMEALAAQRKKDWRGADWQGRVNDSQKAAQGRGGSS